MAKLIRIRPGGNPVGQESVDEDLLDATNLMQLGEGGNLLADPDEDDDGILLEAVDPGRAVQVEIDPFEEGYTFNLDTMEFEAPGAESPSERARSIQIMGNNTSHGTQEAPGEDGLFQNPFDVNGLFNQDTIDSIIELRRQLNFENPEYNPMESGYLLGNTEEDHIRTEEALRDEGRTNNVQGGFGTGSRWLVHPNRIETNIDIATRALYDVEFERLNPTGIAFGADRSPTDTDLYDQVYEGLDVYRVSGAGNWTNTWIEAQRLVDEGEATAIDNMVHALGPRLIRLQTTDIPEEPTRSTFDQQVYETEQQLARMQQMSGSDMVSSAVGRQSHDTIDVAGRTAQDNFRQPVIQIGEGLGAPVEDVMHNPELFRFQNRSRNEVRQLINNMLAGDEAADLQTIQNLTGANSPGLQILNSGWTGSNAATEAAGMNITESGEYRDAPLPVRLRSYNLFMNPQILLADPSLVDIEEFVDDFTVSEGAEATIRNRERLIGQYGGDFTRIVGEAVGNLPNIGDYDENREQIMRSRGSSVANRDDISDEQRLIRLAALTNIAGDASERFPQLSERFNDFMQEEYTENMLRFSLSGDLSNVMGGYLESVFDRFEQSIDAGEDPFADADLSHSMLTALRGLHADSAFGQVVRYGIAVDQYRNNVAGDTRLFSEGGPVDVIGINEDLPTEVRRSFNGVYRSISGVLSGMDRDVERIRANFRADLNFAYDYAFAANGFGQMSAVHEVFDGRMLEEIQSSVEEVLATAGRTLTSLNPAETEWMRQARLDTERIQADQYHPGRVHVRSEAFELTPLYDDLERALEAAGVPEAPNNPFSAIPVLAPIATALMDLAGEDAVTLRIFSDVFNWGRNIPWMFSAGIQDARSRIETGYRRGAITEEQRDELLAFVDTHQQRHDDNEFARQQGGHPRFDRLIEDFKQADDLQEVSLGLSELSFDDLPPYAIREGASPPTLEQLNALIEIDPMLESMDVFMQAYTELRDKGDDSKVRQLPMYFLSESLINEFTSIELLRQAAERREEDRDALGSADVFLEAMQGGMYERPGSGWGDDFVSLLATGSVLPEHAYSDVRGGITRRQESTVGQAMRVGGSLIQGAITAGAEVFGHSSFGESIGFYGEAPLNDSANFWERWATNVYMGLGAMDFINDWAYSHEINDEHGMRTALLMAGLIADFTAPWETVGLRVAFSPVTTATRAGYAGTMALRMPEGARLLPFAAGTFPTIYAKLNDLADTDSPTAFAHATERMVMQQLASGVNVFDAIKGINKETLYDIFRSQGINPNDVDAAVGEYTSASNANLREILSVILADESPGLVALRSRPSYKSAVEQIELSQQRDKIDETQASFLVKLLELQSQAAARFPRTEVNAGMVVNHLPDGKTPAFREPRRVVRIQTVKKDEFAVVDDGSGREMFIPIEETYVENTRPAQQGIMFPEDFYDAIELRDLDEAAPSSLRPGELAAGLELPGSTEIFFSQAERSLRGAWNDYMKRQKKANRGNTAVAEELLKFFKGKTKKAEIEFIGLDSFLSGTRRVTFAEVLDYIQAQQVRAEVIVQDTRARTNEGMTNRAAYLAEQINQLTLRLEESANNPAYTEAMLQEAGRKLVEMQRELQEIEEYQRARNPKERTDGTARYGDLTQDGAENYREFLIRVDTGGPRFGGQSMYGDSGHFRPLNNVLFFIQATDRFDANGNKYLCVETVQSDLLQDQRDAMRRGDRLVTPNEINQRVREKGEEVKSFLEELLANNLEGELRQNRDQAFRTIVNDAESDSRTSDYSRSFIQLTNQEISRKVSAIQDFVDNFDTQFRPDRNPNNYDESVKSKNNQRRDFYFPDELRQDPMSFLQDQGVPDVEQIQLIFGSFFEIDGFAKGPTPKAFRSSLRYGTDYEATTGIFPAEVTELFHVIKEGLILIDLKETAELREHHTTLRESVTLLRMVREVRESAGPPFSPIEAYSEAYRKNKEKRAEIDRGGHRTVSLDSFLANVYYIFDEYDVIENIRIDLKGPSALNIPEVLAPLQDQRGKALWKSTAMRFIFQRASREGYDGVSIVNGDDLWRVVAGDNINFGDSAKRLRELRREYSPVGPSGKPGTLFNVVKKYLGSERFGIEASRQAMYKDVSMRHFDDDEMAAKRIKEIEEEIDNLYEDYQDDPTDVGLGEMLPVGEYELRLEIERHRSKTPLTDEQIFSNFNRVRAGEEYQAPNNQRLADQELFATIPPGVKKWAPALSGDNAQRIRELEREFTNFNDDAHVAIAGSLVARARGNISHLPVITPEVFVNSIMRVFEDHIDLDATVDIDSIQTLEQIANIRFGSKEPGGVTSLEAFELEGQASLNPGPMWDDNVDSRIKRSLALQRTITAAKKMGRSEMRTTTINPIFERMLFAEGDVVVQPTYRQVLSTVLDSLTGDEGIEMGMFRRELLQDMTVVSFLLSDPKIHKTPDSDIYTPLRHPDDSALDLPYAKFERSLALGDLNYVGWTQDVGRSNQINTLGVKQSFVMELFNLTLATDQRFAQENAFHDVYSLNYVRSLGQEYYGQALHTGSGVFDMAESFPLWKSFIEYSGGSVGANTFESTAILLNDKARNFFNRGGVPLWMEKDGERLGSFEVRKNENAGLKQKPTVVPPITPGVPPSKSTIKLALTGHRGEFPEMQAHWDEYTKVAKRIKELRNQGLANTNQRIVELQSSADSYLQELYDLYQPHLQKCLFNDVPDGLFSVGYEKPGFGVWNGDPSEAVIIINIDYDAGNELARDAILGRLAQFSKTFEQGGLLFRENEGIIDVGLNNEMISNPSLLPKSVYYQDAGGVNRAATTVIDVSKNPALQQNAQALLDHMEDRYMGATYDPQAGTITIAHTPEWAGNTPQDHMQVVMAYLRAVTTKFLDIDVSMFRENVYVAEPFRSENFVAADGSLVDSTTTATPEGGYLERTYDYEELILNGLEAEQDAQRYIQSSLTGSAGVVQPPTGQPWQGPRSRLKRPGEPSNRFSKLTSQGFEPQFFAGFNTEARRGFFIDKQTGRMADDPGSSEWKRSKVQDAFKKVGRNDFLRNPATNNADIEFRQLLVNTGNLRTNRITVGDLMEMGKSLGLRKPDFNLAAAQMARKYRGGQKIKELPVSWKKLDVKTATRKKKYADIDGLTNAQLVEFARYFAYQSLKVQSYAGFPESITTPRTLSKAKAKALGKRKIAAETKPNTVERHLARLDEIQAEFPNPLEDPLIFEQFMTALVGPEEMVLRRFEGTVEHMNPQNIVDYLAHDPKENDGATPGMRDSAKHGIELTKQFKQLLESGQMKAEHTTLTFLWGILSRRMSPYPHESLFMDAALGNVMPFIEAAVEGRFDEKMLGPTTDAAPRKNVGKKNEESIESFEARRQNVRDSGDTYAAYLVNVYDEMALYGSPGAQARGNLHDFGRYFLLKMGQPIESGRFAGQSPIKVVHDAIADFSISGPEIRRLFVEVKPGKVGIDLKVVSFILLVLGRDDILVLDRVQLRLQTANERLASEYLTDNIYDGFGFQSVSSIPSWEWSAYSSKVGLGPAVSDVRGIAFYEMMEQALEPSIRVAFDALGDDYAPAEVIQFEETTDYQRFEDAKQRNQRTQFLSPKELEDYEGSQVVLRQDGNVGFVVDPDGDLQNVFSNEKGGGVEAILTAIEQYGAITLDCFDPHLPGYYAKKYGFVEVGRLRFDPAQAPEGWDVEVDGTPDVVIMSYRGGDPATIRSRYGTFGYEKSTNYSEDFGTLQNRARQTATRGRVQGGVPSSGVEDPRTGVGGEVLRQDLGTGQRPDRVAEEPTDIDPRIIKNLGGYHWITWLVSSSQEVSHGSLGAILNIVEGKDDPVAGTRVRSGKLDSYIYGIEYVTLASGERSHLVRDSGNRPYFMNKEQRDEYVERIKKLVPDGYTVGGDTDPWYVRADRTKVDKTIYDLGRLGTAEELRLLNDSAHGSGQSGAGTEALGGTNEAISGIQRGIGDNGVKPAIDPLSGFELDAQILHDYASGRGPIDGRITRAIYASLGAEFKTEAGGVPVNTDEILKIYPIHQITKGKSYREVVAMLIDLTETPGSTLTGWSFVEFGPKFDLDGNPVLGGDGEYQIHDRFAATADSYKNKEVFIHSPHVLDAGAKDPQHTLVWRFTHEVAHALTNSELTNMYGGQGRRAGALGVKTMHQEAVDVTGKPKVFELAPLRLVDALRALEWEHEAFVKQREILKEIGVTITDDLYAQEYARNMYDAVHRVITGRFSSPGDHGIDLSNPPPPDRMLARAKTVVARHAEQLELDMNTTLSEGQFRPFNERTLFMKDKDKILGSIEISNSRFDGGAISSIDTAKYILTFYRDANFDVWLHENGHLMAEVMGSAWRDGFFRSGFELDDNNLPTRRGHEQAAEAWRWYVKTKTAPNGRLRYYFDTLWNTGIRDLWYRIREQIGHGDPEVIINLPPEMVAYWDANLRPDQRSIPRAVEINRKRIRDQAAIPYVKVSDTPQQRIKEGKVQRKQKLKEAMKVNLRPNDVAQALGLKRLDEDGNLIVNTEIAIDELLSKSIAYMYTEQYRRMFGVGDLVRLTNRTIVPASRVGRIRDDVITRFATHFGTPPQQFIKERADGLTGRIELSQKEQVALMSYANEIASEPLGNIVPGRFLDGYSDLQFVTFEEMNYLANAAVDIHAGVAARRDMQAEAAPRNLAKMIGKSLLSVAENPPELLRGNVHDFLTYTMNSLKEKFIIRDEFADFVDPGVKESLNAMIRNLGQVQNWFKSAVRQAKIAGNVPIATLHDIRRQLVPVISVGNHMMLFNARSKFRNLMSDGRASPVPQQIRQLTDPGFLAMVQGVFRDGGGYFITKSGSTENEVAAINLLMEFGHKLSISRRKTPDAGGLLNLTDAEVFELNDALEIVHYGLERRYRLVIKSGEEIAIAMGAGTTESGATNMTVLANVTGRDKFRYYELFYSGRWAELDDHFAAYATGAEETGIPKVVRENRYAEIILRLKAKEEIAKFSEELARLGLLHTYENIGNVGKQKDQANPYIYERESQPLGTLFRDGYLDNVVATIDEMTSGRQSSVRSESEGRLEHQSIRSPVNSADRQPDSVTASFERTLGHLNNPVAKRAYIDAHEILRKFGFKTFQATWVRYLFPDGSEGIIPKMLQDSIDRHLSEVADVGRALGSARRTGITWSAKTAGIRTPDEPAGMTPLQEEQIGRSTMPKGTARIMRMNSAIDKVLNLIPGYGVGLNVGLTVGPLMVIPTPAYMMANIQGAFAQIYQKLGFTGQITSSFAHPRMNVAVVKRMWGKGYQAPGQAIITTKDGRVFTADMIAAEALKRGLNSSFIRSETLESIADDLARTHARAWEKISARGPVNFWAEAATASDNYFRVGVFISEIHKGKSLDEAAESARAALYDYSALTDFERKYVRLAILFYSYMRKNTELFFDTLLTNPHRIANQIRLMNWAAEYFLEDEPEIVLPAYYRARVVTAFKDMVVEGATGNMPYSGTVSILPMLPVSDLIYLFADLADFSSGIVGPDVPGTTSTGEAGAGLLSKLHPWIQAIPALTYDEELFWGREISTSNPTVPAWFVELDQNLLGGFWYEQLGIYPDYVGADRSYLQYTDTNHYVFRVSNPEMYFLMRNAHQVPGFGRSMDVINSLDRANIGVVELGVRVSRQWREFADEMGLYDETLDSRNVSAYDLEASDTMEPRYGMTEHDELMQFFGLRRAYIPTNIRAYDSMAKEAENVLRDAVRQAEDEADFDND